MRALKLDYRKQDIWRRKEAGWIALLLVSLVTAALGWQHRQLEEEIAASEVELSRLAGHRTQSDTRGGSGKKFDTEIGYARDVLMQLDVPWQSLFDAVETTTNEEISLLGIDPDPKREQVRITGEAKSYAAALEYVRRLEASTPLSGVYLQHHQIQTQDRERPIQFIIGAAWRERS